MPVLRFRQGAESGTSGNELAQCNYGADMAVFQFLVIGYQDIFTVYCRCRNNAVWQFQGGCPADSDCSFLNGSVQLNDCKFH